MLSLSCLIPFISTLRSRLVLKKRAQNRNRTFPKIRFGSRISLPFLCLLLEMFEGNKINIYWVLYQFLLINKFTTQDYLKYEGNKETITSSKLVREASDISPTLILSESYQVTINTGDNNIFTDECCPWEYKVSPLDTLAVCVCPSSLNELL